MRRKITCRDIAQSVITTAVVVAAVVSVLAYGAEEPRPKVYLFSPDWFHCQFCDRAENYLDGVADVEVVKLSREQGKALHITGYPTVLVGKTVVVGFDPGAFDRGLGR